MNTADKIRQRIQEQQEITEKAWEATQEAKKAREPFQKALDARTHEWCVAKQKLDLLKMSLSMEMEEASV